MISFLKDENMDILLYVWVDVDLIYCFYFCVERNFFFLGFNEGN